MIDCYIKSSPGPVASTITRNWIYQLSSIKTSLRIFSHSNSSLRKPRRIFSTSTLPVLSVCAAPWSATADITPLRITSRMGCCSLVELGGGSGPVELLGGRHALLDGGGGHQAGLSGCQAQENGATSLCKNGKVLSGLM